MKKILNRKTQKRGRHVDRKEGSIINHQKPETKNQKPAPHVAVVGGGFSGLAAAYELTRNSIPVTLIEGEEELGGLAGSFQVNGQRLEKFYHHWFTNDRYVVELVQELGEEDKVLRRPTSTGMYFAHQFFRLSTPLDVLKFTPLSLPDRIRLGLLVLRARRVKDWKELEDQTAEEWLTSLCGKRVYRVVWEPLLRGKFGAYGREVSASWFWCKLKLRGGSRGKRGEEMLAYYQGGFAALADRMAAEIRSAGGNIIKGTKVGSILLEQGRAAGVSVNGSALRADAVIATPAPPLISELLGSEAPAQYRNQLSSIEYLANICLVLVLEKSLSSTYWLNVNDPEFPFVGVIEHTNFEPSGSYGGKHIVYLSRYLSPHDPVFQMSDSEFVEFCLPHLRRMFPRFDANWIAGKHVWRARYAQPLVVRNYSKLIPDVRSPIPGLYVATMAQVYPEDRGTNYAIRDGRKAARLAISELSRGG